MATPGPDEIEVVQTTPEVGKCYSYAIATRRHDLEFGESKYFTTNTPTYLGKFVRSTISGTGNGSIYTAYFLNQNGEEVELEYDNDYMTCLMERPCRDGPLYHQDGPLYLLGGKRKHRRGTKKAKRSRRKTKRRHH